MWKQAKGELFFFLLALMIVGCSLWILSLMPNPERMTAIAHDAKVIDVSWVLDDDDTYYTPKFTFEDSDHRTFKAESLVRYEHDFNEGEVYQVRYDPNMPKAGCLIVGDEDRLLAQSVGVYLLLFMAVAVAASVIWRWVKLCRASGSPDEASG